MLKKRKTAKRATAGVTAKRGTKKRATTKRTAAKRTATKRTATKRTTAKRTTAKRGATKRTTSKPGTTSRASAGTMTTEGAVMIYRVKASTAAARRQGATAPFSITIHFLGGLTPAQQKAFTKAADRWTRVIVGDLPSVVIGGVRIDDVLIEAEGVRIDGPGEILGEAAPTMLRPRNAGAAAFLPAKGIMSFDTADLGAMERDGTLNDVITHEMGHVLGIGTIWDLKRLLQGAGTRNPTFVGAAAKKEFGLLKGRTVAPTPVPVENRGGDGTADSHWRDTVFQNELMTGFVGAAPNPMSRLTVASLQDLGYKVDVTKAERYSLPVAAAMPGEGEIKIHAGTPEHRGMRPSAPIVLPDTSLVP